MTPRIRRTLAAFATLLMLIASSAPASALGTDDQANTPVVFDTVVLRPLGVVTFLFGTSLFVASLPLVAVTRPQDIGVPFEALVAKPAAFVWGDELGGH